jgi:hypothetical protein
MFKNYHFRNRSLLLGRRKKTTPQNVLNNQGAKIASVYLQQNLICQISL